MIHHRLIAPEGMGPTTIELSGGRQLTVPPDGIVEIPDALVMPGDPGVFEPVERIVETAWLRQLLDLGFRQLARTGPTLARPAAGRYPGDMFFDETLGRPLWWSAGAWRAAPTAGRSSRRRRARARRKPLRTSTDAGYRCSSGFRAR
jgi:hypothetical protein